MRRGEFLALLASATAWPVATRAQPPNRLPVIGLVFTPGSVARMLGPDPASLPARAFVHRMRDLGWIDGRTIIIERRAAESDPKRLSAQFRDLRELGAKLNVLAGARWLQDAAFQGGQVPIITLFHEDPVTAGLVTSLARPGGSITGITTTTGPELYSKRLQFLEEIAPGAKRIAVLGPSDQLDQLRAIQPRPNMTTFPVRIDLAEDYVRAFAMILKQEAHGLLATAGPLNYGNTKRIADFALEHKLPVIFAIREGAADGGLMSYGPSIPGAFRQMAGMVDRFLNGERLGDMPVEQPTVFDLVVNVKTANALGLTVPPTLLALADEVIE